jgi:hypothetical protein
MIRLNIDFKYFIIISSNEMFIRNGLESYIEKYKNGLQIEEFDKNNSWHNFHKGLEKEEIIINLLKELNLDTIYGGQTEGQFYEKHIFQKISDIYLKFFGEKELHHFETEEVICQTIFKSFELSYGKPITLQNYSNKIIFDEFLRDFNPKKLEKKKIRIEDDSDEKEPVKKTKAQPKGKISESTSSVSQEDSSSEIVIKKKQKTKKVELAGTKKQTNKTKKNKKE